MTALNRDTRRRGRWYGWLIAAAVGAWAPIMTLAAEPATVPSAAPGAATAPSAGPVSLLPEQTVPDGAAAPAEPSIDVGDLAAPGVDRIGLVDTTAGGFSAQLWRGTDLELLKQVMPRMPRRLPSPALRTLTKNLLLSPGTPPAVLTQVDAMNAAPPDAGEALPASQWLLEIRVATLAGLGDWAEVQALLDLVPPTQMTDGLRRFKAEANLATNHVIDACALAQAALNTSPDAYWQKIQVFCQIDINQSSAASLGLALLREQRVDDPVFFWAADVLGGARTPVPASFTRLEPLHYAMLRKAGAALPDNLAAVQEKITDPATLGWLAGLALPAEVVVKGDKTPANVRRDRRRALEDARTLLAERAVGVGTLSPEGLRAVYRSVNIKDPAPPPLSQVTAEDVRGRALLFQSALAQTVPTARAEVIALALDLVRSDRGVKGPLLTVMGQAYAEMLGEMEPTADLVWFAGTAARALLAVGPADKTATTKGKAWLDLARNMGRSSREAGQIADSLWPIERLLTGTAATAVQLPPQALRGWAAALPPATPAPDIASKREIVLSLLTAAGEPVTAADWLPVMGGSVRADGAAGLSPHIWNGLDLAAKAGRAGEATVLALAALDEDGLMRVSLPALQQVIASLRIAGRETDARALAVEALLVLGL